MNYSGLTWDHPRGYVALEKAAALAAAEGLSLQWQRQPLEGFESAPIEELAARHDLLVLDHPHIGDAVAAGCLQPLEQHFDSATISDWQQRSIGRAFDSYHYEGRHWALPLDAATQVAACRPELLDAEVPRTWQDVLALARRPGAQASVVLSLAGPHAILSLFSMAAAHGDSPAAADPKQLFAGDGASAAWALMRELYAHSPRHWESRNPIAILGAMAAGDEVAYCPLVYGYVNYAVAAPGRKAITFADAPAGPTGRIGSVLGGTGLALTTRAQPSAALLAHLRWLLSPQTQAEFIPFAEGQPGARAAWHDAKVNDAWNGFFANTQATLEQALVRPRHPGYIPFQTQASAAVREALAAGTSAPALLQRLQQLYEGK